MHPSTSSTEMCTQREENQIMEKDKRFFIDLNEIYTSHMVLFGIKSHLVIREPNNSSVKTLRTAS